ncbi:MAG: hypothetical protein ACK5W0_16155 [Labrys sp. (in: a-proteobacteria)]
MIDGMTTGQRFIEESVKWVASLDGLSIGPQRAMTTKAEACAAIKLKLHHRMLQPSTKYDRLPPVFPAKVYGEVVGRLKLEAAEKADDPVTKAEALKAAVTAARKLSKSKRAA